ncbi:MAG: 6-carboxytetrahydropterin synthase [Proteobacteria bacterium]|nr:6-carboxytetrahydropterin synthase [Pseudomonadota bacterium]
MTDLQIPIEDATVTSSEATPNSSTLFVRDVGKIDCAIFDPSQGIMGQSWYVDVWLTGILDENGFVFDFSPLKSLIKQTLASTLDHSLIIPVQSQSVQYSEWESGEKWILKSKARGESKESKWEYFCPKGSVFPVHAVALKTGVIEAEFCRILRHRLPSTVLALAVKLRDEQIATTEASYKYTHGIQGHNGLCQRLFHGHRSRIEVYVGEERRPDLEHYIAREIFKSNVHIASLSQIKSGSAKSGYCGSNDEPITLAYAGTLGQYEATLPANRVFFVASETSVEAIATELANVIKREEKTNDIVKVVAYEGIDKGAVGIA